MKQNAKFNFCAIYLALLVLVGASPAYPQTAQQVAKKAFGSTVLLVMEDANGQPVSLGSGFFVGKNEIASNLHVVEDAVRGYAKLVGQKNKYDIEGITAIDSERDLVVLKVAASVSPTLTLGDSDAVQVGERVFAVGNPQGLEGTFSQGIVSSVREFGTDKLLQITAPISPGNSGGPVLNVGGTVVGVSVATFRGGQNLNFAIPSNYLKVLVDKTGPTKPLAQASPNKTESSIFANLGGDSTVGVTGGQLTWGYEMPFGDYSFSFRNKLRDNVSDILCLVVFYDKNDNPIDVDAVVYEGVVPAGLAKRVTSTVDGSVQKLTTPYNSETPSTKVEIRILDFKIAE